MNLRNRIDRLEQALSSSRSVLCNVLSFEESQARVSGRMYARRAAETADDFERRVKLEDTEAAIRDGRPRPIYLSEIEAQL